MNIAFPVLFAAPLAARRCNGERDEDGEGRTETPRQDGDGGEKESEDGQPVLL